jgi:hypothetical protein
VIVSLLTYEYSIVFGSSLRRLCGTLSSEVILQERLDPASGASTFLARIFGPALGTLIHELYIKECLKDQSSLDVLCSVVEEVSQVDTIHSLSHSQLTTLQIECCRVNGTRFLMHS